jgi:hypothetical protein
MESNATISAPAPAKRPISTNSIGPAALAGSAADKSAMSNAMGNNRLNVWW